MPNHPPALRTVEAPSSAAPVRAGLVLHEQSLKEGHQTRRLFLVDHGHHLTIGPLKPCLYVRDRLGPVEKRRSTLIPQYSRRRARALADWSAAPQAEGTSVGSARTTAPEGTQAKGWDRGSAN